MNLYKQINNNVDGFNQGIPDDVEYFIADTQPEDEPPVTFEDVQEEDTMYLSYATYELIGPITEEEAETLRKFHIIK